MYTNIFFTKAYYFPFFIKFRKLFVEKWKICYQTYIFIHNYKTYKTYKTYKQMYIKINKKIEKLYMLDHLYSQLNQL
jgi:hypothetical protein